jgi:hypothetical protein
MLHVPGQSMLPGLLVTLPSPPVATVRVCGVSPNGALTTLTESALTVQEPRPVHAPPLHPPNTEPVPAVAVSVALVPNGSIVLQFPGQAMPTGEVTVPSPLTTAVT